MFPADSRLTRGIPPSHPLQIARKTGGAKKSYTTTIRDVGEVRAYLARDVASGNKKY